MLWIQVGSSFHHLAQLMDKNLNILVINKLKFQQLSYGKTPHAIPSNTFTIAFKEYLFEVTCLKSHLHTILVV